MTEGLWPRWYRRFCLRMAVLLISPFALAYCRLASRPRDFEIWREVAWSCWKTGSTEEIVNRYDLDES